MKLTSKEKKKSVYNQKYIFLQLDCNYSLVELYSFL